ncbi:glucosyltransferase domain-containing protein [Paenibacillus lautus]|uniref:glucosyltransferase domain-containing protein n=1 Tax=Paenibacillus lautus TaxID=1401 RepID=UPI002DC0189F|nr:glucosyltransferase domain-containing protein [Paenibacillus lautus]MEC0206304.1 glucosyltransferase domain-containing protein [Paenibacillus lautus]
MIKDIFMDKDRMKFTFKFSFIITFIVHLYFIVNSIKNTDSMWGAYYSNFDSSTVGRFTLAYLSGISSYFDLQYLNGLLSVLYISLTLVLLIELFDVKNKKLIVIFILLYSAFPSVSGTLTYSFLADAYFLSTLLIVLSVYLIKTFNGWLAIIIASLLIYVSLGTYQSNLAYVITLLVVLFIRDSLLVYKSIKLYIRGLLATIFGLILYVFHFKIFERTNNLTTYQGVNEAGNINLSTIIVAFKKAIETFVHYFFSLFEFVNLFEKLNFLFVFIIIIGLILILFKKNGGIFDYLKVIASLVIIPFSIFLIYFISPNVWYHNLMIHQMVFIYILGVIISDILLVKYEGRVYKIYNGFNFIVLCLIGFNLIVITNIYYDKLDTVNNQTYSLMTQVAYDIRNDDAYREDTPILLVGFPSRSLPPSNIYDEKTPPMSPGTNVDIVDQTTKFVNYINRFIGMKNPLAINETDLLDYYANEINNMAEWPNKDSIKIKEDVIIIKFPQ